jgi:hypothetical protein
VRDRRIPRIEPPSGCENTAFDRRKGGPKGPGEAEEILDELARLRQEAGRGEEPFECIVPILSSPAPHVYARLAEKGMTAGVAWPALLALGIEHPSLEQELSYLEQFSDEMIRKLG